MNKEPFELVLTSDEIGQILQRFVKSIIVDGKKICVGDVRNKRRQGLKRFEVFSIKQIDVCMFEICYVSLWQTDDGSYIMFSEIVCGKIAE